ncbi:MAG: PSP1 domain-containing protein [Eubacteriales bacterium]
MFYFTADERVDFRELVKDLASQFRTRIELRQIGVRDAKQRCSAALALAAESFAASSFGRFPPRID